MRLLAALALLAACGSDDSTPVTTPAFDIQACSKLYAQDTLPTFELDVLPADWTAIQADYAARVKDTYYPATFHYDGDTAPVAIKLRGSSANWVGPKMQFLISFNHDDKDARFHGLRKISLDASVYDKSLLRERVALSILRDAGLPAQCENSARLVVNGTYVGLYSNVEHADHEYIERIFKNPDGDLFSIDSETGMWERDTNEGDDNFDRLNTFLSADRLDAVENMEDIPASIIEWAGEAMLPHAEGYLSGVGNYLLYDHPERGFIVLPYDLDSAFFFNDVSGTDLDTADPLAFTFPGFARPEPLQVVLADEGWRTQFIDQLRTELATYDVAALQGRTDAWDQQIAADLATDPDRGFTDDEHAAAVAEIREFLAARRQFMSDWLAAH